MAPPLHPGTLKPIGPDDLAPLFPMGLIMQEVSTEREIEIPGEVRQLYAQWRPSPLFRARLLEKALDTPAHIFYKYEGGVSGHFLSGLPARTQDVRNLVPDGGSSGQRQASPRE
jgi:predicted alternative tryptophan synthase beta-subunit